ncbi:MAG: RnfABCDGE type electron transport complex subunit D [Pseudanabaenaceae cyanobacterium]
MDARWYQILFLFCFLILGVLTRDWTIAPLQIITVVSACLISQWLACGWLGRSFQQSWQSALITSLGVVLLLRSESYLVLAVAGVLGIISKFIFHWQGKHWFNPANFGIVVTLLTQKAWVSPGQWGEDMLYALIFLCCGGLVLRKVGRWDTTLTFLLGYGGLEALRNFYLGWEWDVLTHRLLSGSLLLFAFFMLTDPRSIPDDRRGRILWTTAIACLTFILRNWFYLSDAPFFALFILSPLSVLCDNYWRAPRFQWLSRKPLLLPH